MPGWPSTIYRGTVSAATETKVGSLYLEDQERMIEEVRGVIMGAPLVRPRAKGGAPMRVRITSAGDVGWFADGSYRYMARQLSGRSWPPIPQRWLELADQFAGHYPWDTALVNWYDANASLGWHVDRTELDTSLPIVTFSLGDTARWAVKDPDTGAISRDRLISGDVTLLSGRLRSAEHCIEGIEPEELFSPLPRGTRGRISVTVRCAMTRPD